MCFSQCDGNLVKLASGLSQITVRGEPQGTTHGRVSFFSLYAAGLEAVIATHGIGDAIGAAATGASGSVNSCTSP
jgi:hypothetical protein